MELHKKKNIPKLIFAVNDSVAHGIYAAANELGLKIPRDIAVIGFGDVESSRLMLPPMTSVYIPVKKMAEKAVDLLIDEISNPKKKSPQRIVFEAELKVRQSI